MASEKITVTVPAEVLGPVRESAGGNLSAYVTRALRAQLVQEAMDCLAEDLEANPAFRLAHDEWLADMQAEQTAISEDHTEGNAE
jgi:hypothetical protein